MPDPRYKYVNIDLETYEKITRQAEDNYRTIPAHIRFLVDSMERESHQDVTTEECRSIAAIPAK